MNVEWICRDCAKKLCKGMLEGHIACYHEGKCNVCGEKKTVTEPRDYRYWKESDGKR